MKIISLIIFLLISFHIKAITCTAVSNGAWHVASTWSCNRAPQGGDTLIIPQGITVNITSNTTITTSIFLNIFGTLSFDNGTKLYLPDNSIIYISSTGLLEKGNGGGSSNVIDIGGVDVWKASDGNLSGILYLTKNCYVNCISLPLSTMIFSVEKNGNDIIINYIDLTVNKIIIQKSYNLKDWIDIISVNTDNYTYIDTDDNSVVYYRIKIDNTYSNIKSVFNDVDFIKIYPNPSSKDVVIYNNLDIIFHLNIYTMDGKKIVDSDTKNTILSLEKGIYLLVIDINNTVYRDRLIISD